jgi:hypothetical protein
LEPSPDPSPEKKSVSRITAAKSATVPPAITSCPNPDALTPASFSTGTISPSDVAVSAIPINSGESTSPTPASSRPTTSARPSEIANPIAGRRSSCPRRCARSTSRPARNSRKASPITARTDTSRSSCTQSSTDGPTTIPATISSTTAGSRTFGKRPRSSGTANAIADTMTSPLKEMSGTSASQHDDDPVLS